LLASPSGPLKYIQKREGEEGFCLKEKGIIMEYIYTNAENWTPWRW
jgi:hypothetical protein